MKAIQCKFGTLLIIAIVACIASNAEASTQDGGVVLVDQTNLEKLIRESNHLVLYLSQDDCRYCAEFSEVFTLVSKLHTEVSRFSKINYSSSTAQLFQNYQIESTPTVLAFQKGHLLPYRFEPMGSGNTLSVQFFKWIQRLYLPMKYWDEEQNHSHQLIVHCNTEELKSFWKDIERNQLWLDVYCGKQEQLNEHLVVVYEYGRRVEAWQLDTDNFSEISTKIKRLIKAYKYKYILNWNTAVAQEVFAHNISAFIMITNNESLSRQIYTYYEDIKRRWYENSHNYEPTIFAVSDLSLKTYQTLKLKHYLTGFVPFSLKEYYYPIIGFISRGEREGKYLLDLVSEKNKTGLEQFVASVNDHLIKGNSYKEGEEELQRWLSEEKENHDIPSRTIKQSDKDISDKEKDDEGLIKLGVQQEWNQLLSLNYRKSFFVYITWRFDYRMQTLEKEFANWWKSSVTSYAPHHEKYSIFFHLPHLIDLPIHPDLSFEYLPALFFINQYKEVTKLEGVTDLSKIKKFINDIYLMQTTQEKSTKDKGE